MGKPGAALQPKQTSARHPGPDVEPKGFSPPKIFIPSEGRYVRQTKFFELYRRKIFVVLGVGGDTFRDNPFDETFLQGLFDGGGFRKQGVPPVKRETFSGMPAVFKKCLVNEITGVGIIRRLSQSQALSQRKAHRNDRADFFYEFPCLLFFKYFRTSWRLRSFEAR